MRKSCNMFILKIKSQEELTTALKNYCRAKGIRAGWVSAVGALDKATLAHFNPKSKKYTQKQLSGQVEIAALTGIISLCRGDLHLHLHAALADRQFQTFSGHLTQARVNPTAEVTIMPYSKKLSRRRDSKIGLDILSTGDRPARLQRDGA